MNKTVYHYIAAVLATLVVAVLSLYLPSLRIGGEGAGVSAGEETGEGAYLTDLEKHELMGRYHNNDERVNVEFRNEFSASDLEQMTAIFDDGIDELAKLTVLPSEFSEINISDGIGDVVKAGTLTFSDGTNVFRVWLVAVDVDFLTISAHIDKDSGKILFLKIDSQELGPQDFSKRDGYIGPYMEGFEQDVTFEGLANTWAEYWGREVEQTEGSYNKKASYDYSENLEGEFDFVSMVTYSDDNGDSWLYRIGWGLDSNGYLFYVRPFYAG